MSSREHIRAVDMASGVLLEHLTFHHGYGTGWVLNPDMAPAWVAKRIVDVVVGKLLALHTEHEGRCTHCLERCDCLLADDLARVADCPHGNVEWPCATIAALGAL